MTAPSREAQQGLEALRIAVEKALDRKRRLGQYAVGWVGGKPTYIGVNTPQKSEPIIEIGSRSVPEPP